MYDVSVHSLSSTNVPLTPGLEIHTSNRLGILCDHLCAAITESPLHPLEAELIIVQSQGMQRWLTLEFAQRLGIAANLSTPFPVSFCEQLTATAPDKTLDREALTWKLFALLSNPDEKIATYLDDDRDQRKRYQLAARVANRFEDYQLYRPDLIHNWNGGPRPSSAPQRSEHEGWQEQLWRAVPELKAVSERARNLADLGALAQSLDPARLPSRVSVFGVSTLPPAVLDLLQVLARKIPVRIYFVSPTYHFWGDIRSEREQARLQRRLQAPESSEDLDTGNPLLASLGRQGRDFFNLLQARDPDGTAWQELEFEDLEPESALAGIQHDILHLVNRSAEDEPPMPIAPDDESLQVHVCHSPMREMEVIRDQLLARFDQDPSLRPHDVLILVPDISEYGPYVQAVFTCDHRGTPKIPVHLADRDLGQEHPLATAFLQILEAAHDRLEASQVLDLLEVPAIRRSFDLEDADIPTLRAWANTVNIRWGLDGADRQAQQKVPAFEANTWRQGLDRLLLGFALGPTDQLVMGTAPHGEDTTGRSEVLGSFVDFAETLFTRLPDLRREQSAGSWSAVLLTVIDSLFTASTETEEAGVQFLRDHCANLAEAMPACEHPQASISDDVDPEPETLIHPAVIREHLARILQNDSQGTSFLTGRVTVCALKPMRTIPFKVVAVAGLHDGSFPRSDSPLPFDLIAQTPRPGDRSLRDDDRYLFLETILACEQCLIITYVGRSQKDESESPPSPVLAELLDTVERSFTCDSEVSAADQITTLHPLTAFSPAYFDLRDERLFSYSQENLDACRITGTRGLAAPAFVPEPIAAAADTPSHERAAEGSTQGQGQAQEAKLQLDLEDLIRFWSNPSRGFCERRLELRIPRLDEQELPSEPFVLDPLERYKLQDWLLERRQHKPGGREQDLELARQRGQLPVGSLGAACHRNTIDTVDTLWNEVEPYAADDHRTIDITGADWNITGSVDNLCPQGRIQFRCAKISAKDLLSAWLRHLALHISQEGRDSGTDIVSILHATGVDPQHLRSTSNAREQLQTFIDGYRLGMTTPLPFFPKTSHDIARRIHSPKKPVAQDEAISAAKSMFNLPATADTPPTEGQDPYVMLCFRHCAPLELETLTDRDTIIHWAEAIWKPILEHLAKGTP